MRIFNKFFVSRKEYDRAQREYTVAIETASAMMAQDREALRQALSDVLGWVDRVAELKAQLPDGMKDCTIEFIECPVGHGRLWAKNWKYRECLCCHIIKLKEELKECTTTQN